MKLLNKTFSSGLASGIVVLFTLFSVFLMNPQQMWRWLFHPDSSDQKMERALLEPSESIVSQESDIHANGNNQEKETMLIQENERLKNDLETAQTQMKEVQLKLDESETVIAKLKAQLSSASASNSDSGRSERSVTSFSGLQGKTIILDCSDGKATNVAQLKTKLEGLGLTVQLTEKNYDYSSFYRNKVHYKTDENSGLAHTLLEFLSEYGFEEVEKSNKIDGEAEFAIGIWYTERS
jgi:hypothetical protein